MTQRHDVCASMSPFVHANALLATAPVSSAKIPTSVDRQMDKQMPTNGEVQPGISMANGPVTEQDTKMSDVNGAMTNGAVPAKRKVRESLARPDYADAESSDDDQPMVCAPFDPVCKDLID